MRAKTPQHAWLEDDIVPSESVPARSRKPSVSHADPADPSGASQKVVSCAVGELKLSSRAYR